MGYASISTIRIELSRSSSPNSARATSPFRACCSASMTSCALPESGVSPKIAVTSSPGIAPGNSSRTSWLAASTLSDSSNTTDLPGVASSAASSNNSRRRRSRNNRYCAFAPCMRTKSIARPKITSMPNTSNVDRSSTPKFFMGLAVNRNRKSLITPSLVTD